MILKFLSSVTIVLALTTPSVWARRQVDGNLGSFAWDRTRFLFAFGDSYSTTGWRPSDGVLSPDQQLTVSNGPNWLGYLTSTFNESQVFLRDLAVSGATIDNDLVAATDHETGVKQQIDAYEKFMADGAPGLDWESGNTLFVMWVGINDIGFTYERENQKKWHRKEMRVWYEQQERLYTSGARHFLYMSVPPTHATPLFGGNENVKIAVLDFNLQLRANAIRFQSEHPDAVVLWYDAYSTFGRLLETASEQGFKNYTEPCWAYQMGTPTPTTRYSQCVNPVNEYFWMDQYHPNSPVHKLLAREVKSFLDNPSWLPDVAVSRPTATLVDRRRPRPVVVDRRTPRRRSGWSRHHNRQEN